METKCCPDCKQTKSLDGFPRNKSAAQGRAAYCRPCWSARSKVYAAAAAARPEKKVPAKKFCSKCETTKSGDEFYRHNQTRDGLAGSCKECWNAYYRERLEDPQVRAKHTLAVRRNHLHRRYGLTIEDYEQMLDAQGGTCAICDGEQTVIHGSNAYFAVDHCHNEGQVRGLLCNSCNVLLHKLDTHPGWLERATLYLEGSRV